MKSRVEHHKRNSTSPSSHVFFCVLYERHFSKAFRGFPKMSLNSPYTVERCAIVADHFPKFFENVLIVAQHLLACLTFYKAKHGS